MRTLLWSTLAALVVLSSMAVWAIPPAIPRQYQPLPVDTNVFFLPYIHLDSNTSLDTSLPIVATASLSMNAIQPTYLRYYNVGGNTAYLFAGLPWARVTGRLESSLAPGALTKTQSGLGDPIIGFSYGVLGEPAMTPMEFVKWKGTTTLNAAVYASPPLGTYHRDQVLNTGTNRWAIKPELAFSYRTGRLLSEIYANAQIYTDNTDFLAGRTLSQDPLYALEGHFSYDIRPDVFASFDVYQRWGGKAQVDSLPSTRSQNYTVLGFTLNATVSPQDTFYFMYGTVIDGSTGPDFTAIQVLYGRLW